jgi:hypothetical protein
VVSKSVKHVARDGIEDVDATVGGPGVYAAAEGRRGGAPVGSDESVEDTVAAERHD